MHCHTDLTIFCKREKLSICVFGSFLLTSDSCLSTSNTYYVPLRFRPLLLDSATKLEISICSICFNCLWFTLIHHKYPETTEISWPHKEDIKYRKDVNALNIQVLFGKHDYFQEYTLGCLVIQTENISRPAMCWIKTDKQGIFLYLLLFLSVEKLIWNYPLNSNPQTS